MRQRAGFDMDVQIQSTPNNPTYTTVFGSQVDLKRPESLAVTKIKQGAIQSLPAPVLVAAYLLATLDSPERPLMLGVTFIMVVITALNVALVRRISESRFRVVLSGSSSAAYMLSAVLLGYLDGGISSPLGALCLFFLPFVATTMPPRVLAVVSAGAVAGYWWVALTSSPFEIGRAMVYTFAFIALTATCSIHSAALVKLKRRLSEACILDPLSGCLNRRGFDAALTRKIHDHADAQPPVAFIAIDLDRFKSINDMFGHRAGDATIKFVGQQLARVAGPDRLVARTGGDEFVIAVVGEDGVAAEQLAADARASLLAHISASVGVGRCPQDATTLEDALTKADLKAYENKKARAGKLAPPTAPPTDCEPEAVQADDYLERRRQAIVNTAWLAGCNSIIAVAYVAMQNGPHRLLLLLLTLTGLGIALFMKYAASKIAASSARRIWMRSVALLLLADSVAIAVADGGVESPLALGMLMPLVFVALSAPPKAAIPVIIFISASYLAVATLVGSPSAWYVFGHLAGMLSIALLESVRSTAAAARRSELDNLRRFDPLTGCLTRAGFEHRVNNLQTDESCTETSNWIVAIDLDHFKALNDDLGHVAGDDLLAWVAGRFRNELRTDDLLARFGGDEFIVALMGYPADQASEAIERLDSAISARTNASFGIATLSDRSLSLCEAIGTADDRMYADKRNRAIGLQGLSSSAAVPALDSRSLIT